MCGIFGIAFPAPRERLGTLLFEAGKRLTYRGYDSVGCATISNGTIDLRKDKGKIHEVCEKYKFQEMSGIRGILQLRWATFGAPSQRNAQPHLDCSGDIVGAHNGNIVNTMSLREQYINEGHNVRGRNDGEIVVHTVEKHLLSQPDGRRDWNEAIIKANRDLQGDYAYVITDNRKNELYCAKKGSSLYLGVGEDFVCCSSDLPSILPLTQNIVLLNDNEFIRFDHNSYQIYDMITGEAIPREAQEMNISPENASKGEYPYFMLKEIHEQPQAAKELLNVLYASEFVEPFLEYFDRVRTIFFIGAGSSYNACVTGAYYFNKIAKVPVVPVIAGQFLEMYGNTLEDDSLLVCVSQSGETKDIINIVNYARKIGKGKVLGILNVLGSTLMNRSEAYLPLACNLEISVPATKTFVNQVALLYFLALKVAEKNRKLSGKELQDEHRILKRLPDLIQQTIEQTEEISRQLATELRDVEDIYSLGYGVCHGPALEGALKIKEVTYSHCEGMYSAEFKHGPLSIVEKDYPVIYNAVPENCEMIISHINEVSCRDGKIIVVSEDCEPLIKEANIFIKVPQSNQVLGSILHVIPLQLLSYYWAVAKGLNPDEPRNLSKTLTVD